MKLKINLPTKITFARIFLAILLLIALFVFYFLDYFKVLEMATFNISINNITINYMNIIFLVVFLIASFTDFLDGYLARKNNLVTDLGKFLDPLADKMLINGLMVFYALNFPSLMALNNGNTINTVSFPIFIVVIMIIRDLIVDSLRFMAASKQRVIAANIYGKVKTVTQMIAITIVMLNGFPFSLFDYNFIPFLHISDIACYIAGFFSVLSGIIYVKDNYKVLF